jgi:hypothetical protein
METYETLACEVGLGSGDEVAYTASIIDYRGGPVDASSVTGLLRKWADTMEVRSELN